MLEGGSAPKKEDSSSLTLRDRMKDIGMYLLVFLVQLIVFPIGIALTVAAIPLIAIGYPAYLLGRAIQKRFSPSSVTNESASESNNKTIEKNRGVEEPEQEKGQQEHKVTTVFKDGSAPEKEGSSSLTLRDRMKNIGMYLLVFLVPLIVFPIGIALTVTAIPLIAIGYPAYLLGRAIQKRFSPSSVTNESASESNNKTIEKNRKVEGYDVTYLKEAEQEEGQQEHKVNASQDKRQPTVLYMFKDTSPSESPPPSLLESVRIRLGFLRRRGR